MPRIVFVSFMLVALLGALATPAKAYGERIVCYRDYNGNVVCERR